MDSFQQARLAQSIEHQTSNLRVVSSSPTVCKKFSFCILLLSVRSWQVDWSLANVIKHGVHSRYKRAGRIVIWKKNGGGTSSQYTVV